MASINAKGLRQAIKLQFQSSRKRWLSAMDATWFDITKGIVKHFTELNDPRLFLSSTGEWSAVSSGNVQRFRYTCTGLEGTSILVNLPAARENNTYNVQVTQATYTALLMLGCPLADRTVSQFRIRTSVAVTAADSFDIVVADNMVMT